MSLCSPLWAQIDEAQLRRDLAALTQHPTRVIGSEGYVAAAEYIERQIAAMPNVELRRHEFPVMMPVTHAAVLRRAGAASGERVYPFWPAGVRLNATPAEGITGRCIYVGDASYERIRPAELAGQIAVVEGSARERWANAFYFGAKAALILGSPDTNNADLRSHDLTIPANLPRFYVPPGKLCDDLRAGAIGEPVGLKVLADWERTNAVNFYALVRPAALNPDARPGALVISVPFDSSGLVPDLAAGASQAVQAAAGLALLRDLSAHPLDRPVVVFFGGADSIQMLATRNMLMALADVPTTWREQLDALRAKQSSLRRDIEHLRQLSSDPTLLDVSRDRSLIDRIVQIIQTDETIEQDELFRLRRSGSSQDPQRENQLVARQVLLSRLRFTFSQRPTQLVGELASPALAYLDRAGARLNELLRRYHDREKELTRRIELYQWLSDRAGRNRDPGMRSNDNRLIELLVSLDLTDGGGNGATARCGPMFFGQLLRTSNISQVQDYREWFARREREFAEGDPNAAWWGGIRKAVDFEPFNGARPPESWLCASMAIGSEVCPAWGVPGFSLITLDDLRLWRDTPNDTPANVNVGAIVPQLRGLRELLRRASNDPKFRGQADLKWQRTQVSGQVVSPAPGRPVPDLPRDRFLATYYYTFNNLPKIPQPLTLSWPMGVRRSEVRDADAEGIYQFEGLPRLGELQMLAIEAYRPEKQTGAITAATDLGKQAGDIKVYADIRNELDPLRSVVFTCDEFALTGLYDPRFLQSLGEVIPLDARRDAEPQRYNAIVAKQIMAGFVEPGAATSLVFRFGRVGNRLILANMRGDDGANDSPLLNGAGFTAAELNALGPLALASGRDFFALDRQRLAQYRRAGVRNTLIDAMQSAAGEQLDAAAASMKANDGAAMMKQATGALADDARVYAAAQDMANDVVRGAIFLLLLCVPFAFCMERLLIATPNVYRQISGVAAIFAVMTLMLWSFHPAFRISSSPLIIVLAFAIIFMSAGVIAVVYGKFDSELKRAGGTGAAPASSSLARASVLGNAVVLGVANMRKRKFRAALTSITIVLITFAVLCFTSATRYLDTTTIPLGQNANYPGVMLRQRGYRAMPEQLMENLRPLVSRDRRIVQRWWNVDPSEPREMIHVVREAGGGAAAKIAPAAVIGLSPGESRLSRIGDVIGDEKFARMERGELDIIFVSSRIAESLGAAEGDRVTVGGIGLTVAGIFDGARFDRDVHTLSGEPLTPLKYQTSLVDAGGQSLSENRSPESLELDAGAAAGEAGNAYEHLPANQVAIVPAAISRLLPNASLRSVAIRVAEDSETADRADASVKSLSEQLARRFAVAQFAGDSTGVRMVAASNLASVSGLGGVAVPLAIAALIIFNTMMGSIAERRREIYVYTSLGLAPLHVGALFLAEALTYGLIGTVFGYILGQGVATAMLRFGWLGNVTLNYSGTSAMLTMGLILLVVLISALLPARTAARIASPSIERSWKVPPPIDGHITASLPFTINQTAADGALAYLAEFFNAHRETSIGRFAADNVEIFDDDANGSRGVRAIIWLTPFDLGIRQRLTLRIHRSAAFADIFEVQLILERLSGDDASWHRMNRTFLAALRRQFLQWRTLSPGTMMEYVTASRTLRARASA